MTLPRRLLSLSLASSLIAALAFGQTKSPDSNDELRSVVVLTRHGVRAPIESEIRGSLYNGQPWPKWTVEPGVLSDHGTKALNLLGEYYRARYSALLPHGGCDNPGMYVEANSTQRTIASAKAMLTGLAPDCAVEVHTRDRGQSNPLFSAANGSLVDSEKLAAAINGRLAGRPEWFTAAFAEPLAQMYRIVHDCTGSDCDSHKQDLRGATARIAASPGRGSVSVETPVSIGADFAEHFLLQYTEGFPMEKVGWGRVSRTGLNRLMEMNTRFHDFILRTPYYAQVAGSDLAGRIGATLESAASGKPVPGSLGGPRDRFVLLVGHDSNLAWLGGLLRLDWLLPDQTFNATPPGSSLVFELHRNKTTGAGSVQVFFISQTLDQMRNLSPLNGPEYPSVAPVFVPGCSGSGTPAAYACSVEDFSKAVASVIDRRLMETPAR